MKLNTRFQVLFLLFVLLGVFYPAIFADYNSVDDREMVNSFMNRLPNVNLFDFFHPSQKFYYRPLLLMTYLLDGTLWFFQPFFMHLENVLLHTANTILVFCLAKQVIIIYQDKKSLLPMLSALLFGLHPIVTESACWISGRTDLLGTFFVLLSFLTLVFGLKGDRVWYGFFAALFLVAGVMSKEVMLFFLPLAVFLLLRWPASYSIMSPLRRWALSGVYAMPFLFSAALYGLVRFQTYASGDQGVLHILNNYGYTLFDTIRVCFKVFGFYVKKLFFPLPLNFAIVQVNDHYVWLGILVLGFMFFALVRRRLGTDLLLVSFGLILPAIVIALTRVAWTPLAERYLYLPAVFFSIGIVAFLYDSCKSLSLQRFLVPVMALALLPMGWVSASRAMVWQDNLLLYGDTIRKSPEFLPLYNEYAVALTEHGRLAEAKEYLDKGRQIDTGSNVLAVHSNQASLLVDEGDIDKALQVLKNLMLANNGLPSTRQLRGVAKVGEQIMVKSMTPAQSDLINQLLTDVYNQLYLQTKDPFIRYRQAQFAMSSGDRSLASLYFKQAYNTAPESAHYRQAAKILAAKMNSEQ